MNLTTTIKTTALKTGLTTLAMACSLVVSGGIAHAQDKPAIEVITHAGAGGGTDVNSRMMMLRALMFCSLVS